MKWWCQCNCKLISKPEGFCRTSVECSVFCTHLSKVFSKHDIVSHSQRNLERVFCPFTYCLSFLCLLILSPLHHIWWLNGSFITGHIHAEHQDDTTWHQNVRLCITSCFTLTRIIHSFVSPKNCYCTTSAILYMMHIVSAGPSGSFSYHYVQKSELINSISKRTNHGV